MNKQHTTTVVLDLQVLGCTTTRITSERTAVYIHITRCLIGTPVAYRWTCYNSLHLVYIKLVYLDVNDTIYGCRVGEMM